MADKIYRNRKNLIYCKARGIRFSDPALGRLKKSEVRYLAITYQDNANRIVVERGFSQLKDCFGADLITNKQKETMLSSIALSVIALTLSKFLIDSLHSFLFSLFDGILSEFWGKFFRFGTRVVIIQ